MSDELGAPIEGSSTETVGAVNILCSQHQLTKGIILLRTLCQETIAEIHVASTSPGTLQLVDFIVPRWA
jgi:hypothetical protein